MLLCSFVKKGLAFNEIILCLFKQEHPFTSHNAKGCFLSASKVQALLWECQNDRLEAFV